MHHIKIPMYQVTLPMIVLMCMLLQSEKTKIKH